MLWTVLPSWLCLHAIKDVSNWWATLCQFHRTPSVFVDRCWLTSIVTSGVDRPKTTRCRSATWLHCRKIYTNKRKRCAMVQKKTLIVLWCDKNPIFFLMLIKAELKSSTELFSLHTTSFDHSWINTENKFTLKVAAAPKPSPKKEAEFPTKTKPTPMSHLGWTLTSLELRCDTMIFVHDCWLFIGRVVGLWDIYEMIFKQLTNIRQWCHLLRFASSMLAVCVEVCDSLKFRTKGWDI